MSLIDQPELFERLAPSMVVETYGRDGGPDKPRFRLELRSDDSEIQELALKATMPCVCCGEEVHPFRVRKGSTSSSMYFAATCPLAKSIGCSRSTLAAIEHRSFCR